jgi:hypothetical protein
MSEDENTDSVTYAEQQAQVSGCQECVLPDDDVVAILANAGVSLDDNGGQYA